MLTVKERLILAADFPVAYCTWTACRSGRSSRAPSVAMALASAPLSCLLLALNPGGSAHSAASLGCPAAQTHPSGFTFPGDVLHRNIASPGSGAFCKQAQKCKRSRALVQLLISRFGGTLNGDHELFPATKLRTPPSTPQLGNTFIFDASFSG